MGDPTTAPGEYLTEAVPVILDYDHETGRLLLDDGSAWVVEPEGFTPAILWLPSQSVTVKALKDGTVRIRNLELNESVTATPWA